VGVVDRSLRGVADEDAEPLRSLRLQEPDVVLSRGKLQDGWPKMYHLTFRASKGT
jgi:hypothetical protein